MTNKTEQKLFELYASYQTTRTAMVKGDSDLPVESKLNAMEGEINDVEKQVLSLYRNFQRNRIPDREAVIQNVMSLAESQSSEQNKIAAAEGNVSNESSLLAWLQSFITPDSGVRWQTAVVFSVALVVTSIVSFIYVDQEKAGAGMVAVMSTDIPDLLMQHRQEVAENIQVNLNTQFGFSSSFENYQLAFQAGLLMVEMPILVRANQQGKLQQTILKANSLVKQSSDSNLKLAMSELNSQLVTTQNTAERVNLIDDYVLIVQHHFQHQPEKPVFEFAKWLEISLLATQLDNVDRSSLMINLLQQGKLKVQGIDESIIGEPALIRLINQIQTIDDDSVASNEGMDVLRKKLQLIKAALL